MTRKEALENLRRVHEEMLRTRPSYKEANQSVKRNMQAALRYQPQLFQKKDGTDAE